MQGIFDPEIVAAAWFDPELIEVGWFDPDLVEADTGGDESVYHVGTTPTNRTPIL